MASSPEPIRQARDIYAFAFALLILGALGYAIFVILRPLAEALTWAAIVAFLLSPITVRLMADRDRMRSRNLIALTLTLLALLFLVGPLSAVLAAFVGQAAGLLRTLRGSEASLGDIMSELAQTPLLGGIVDWLRENAGITGAQLDAWLADGARSGLQLLASLGGEVMLGAVDTAVAFGVMAFALFFFIRDGAGMLAMFFELVPLSQERTDRLAHHTGGVIRAVVFGVGLTALIQGSLVGVGFAVAGLPAPIVFGALASLFALLPVGGPSIVWTPAALALAIQGRWVAALFLIGWGLLLVATIDNIIRPLLVSHRSHVGTFTVFVGALGGAAAMGPIGLLLGPVLLALGLSLIRFLQEIRAIGPEGEASPDEDEARPCAGEKSDVS